MPRKKKAEITETKIEKVTDYSESWYVERLGDKLTAKQGKDLTVSSTFYLGFYGPFSDKEKCLLALEELKKIIEKQVEKAKKIAKAEPAPLPFEKKEKKPRV